MLNSYCSLNFDQYALLPMRTAVLKLLTPFEPTLFDGFEKASSWKMHAQVPQLRYASKYFIVKVELSPMVGFYILEVRKCAYQITRP